MGKDDDSKPKRNRLSKKEPGTKASPDNLKHESCKSKSYDPCEKQKSRTPVDPCAKPKPCEEVKFECTSTEKTSDCMKKTIQSAQQKASVCPKPATPPSTSPFKRLGKNPLEGLQKKIDELRKKFALPKFAPPKFTPPKASDLVKYLPKIPKMPELNKENLICAVKCSKDWIIANCDPKKMADKVAAGPSRPMKFPYTFSAKFAQFPIKHYFNNQWIWKYYFVSVAVCIPIFYSINKLANSPGNVAKWAEIRRKEAAEHHH